jgi:tetratricopeptide (TPR) repeat protein
LFAVHTLAVMAVCSFPAAAQTLNPFAVGRPVDQFDLMTARFNATENGLSTFHQTPARSRAGAVSVDELRHPLSEKAGKWLLKAWTFATKGDHAMAITTIQEGSGKVRELAPYSHELLGIEYLLTGRQHEAVEELTAAVSFFPHDAAVRSNLALSLCLVRDYERAEQEARVALYIEPRMSSAEEIMQIVAERKAKLAPNN